MPYKDPRRANARNRAWKIANREKVLEQKRRYHRSEAGRAAARRKYLRYQEQVKATSAAFSRSHPEMARAKRHRRLARKSGAEGRYGPEHMKALKWLQGGHCFYCPVELVDGFQVDHIVPLTRGGINWPSNLVLSCAPCNASKGSSDVLLWAMRRESDRKLKRSRAATPQE